MPQRSLGMPSVATAFLKFDAYFNLAGGSAIAPQQLYFSCNNAAAPDPLATLAGDHQCMNWHTYQLVYRYFRVLSSNIDWTVRIAQEPEGAGSDNTWYGVWFGSMPQGAVAPTGAQSLTEMLENGGRLKTLQNPTPNSVGTAVHTHGTMINDIIAPVNGYTVESDATPGMKLGSGGSAHAARIRQRWFPQRNRTPMPSLVTPTQGNPEGSKAGATDGSIVPSPIQYYQLVNTVPTNAGTGGTGPKTLVRVRIVYKVKFFREYTQMTQNNILPIPPPALANANGPRFASAAATISQKSSEIEAPLI